MIAVPTVMDLTELAEFVFGPDSLLSRFGAESRNMKPIPDMRPYVEIRASPDKRQECIPANRRSEFLESRIRQKGTLDCAGSRRFRRPMHGANGN